MEQSKVLFRDNFKYISFLLMIMKQISGLNELKKHYQREDIARSYEKLRFSDLAGKIEHEITLDLINSLISKYKPDTLLEIATGPGRLTKNINLWNKGIGVDYSNSMLKLAKKNVNNKKWKFIRADIMKMPFKDDYFDMIVTFRLLSHFNNIQRENSYKKIRKILKKDGLLIFEIGNKNYKKPHLIRALLKIYRLFKKEKKHELLPGIYSDSVEKEQLINELKINKFNIEKIYGVNYYNSIVLLLLSLSKRFEFLSSFIKSFILYLEKSNQNKLKNYATLIVIAKNEKY